MTLATAKRFTITEYHRLADIGFFSEDDRIELIKGEIIEMAAKGKAHSVCNTRLYRELFKLLEEKATIRGQEPIIIINNNSEPEPDLIIVKNTSDDYFLNHPTPSDIFLLIEVADSSLKYDQEVKLPLYSEAGISDYWIFNLIAYYLECYNDPYHDLQGKFGYRHKSIILPNESVKLPSFPELILDLTKVFPGKN
jgi:Uma2 family endonuclease